MHILKSQCTFSVADTSTIDSIFMQLESQIKSRVVTDEAEPADRTRTESLLRVPSQVRNWYCFAKDEL